VFFAGRLAVPQTRHGFEARRVFFCPLAWGVLGEMRARGLGYMAKKKVEEKINLDAILFKCRDILRAARNSGSFFEKRDMMLTLVFLRFIGERFEMELKNSAKILLLKGLTLMMRQSRKRFSMLPHLLMEPITSLSRRVGQPSSIRLRLGLMLRLIPPCIASQRTASNLRGVLLRVLSPHAILPPTT
jgi:hypothetical protein